MLVPLVMLLGGMNIGFIVLLSELRRNKVSQKELQKEKVIIRLVMAMFHMMSHISFPRQRKFDDNMSIVSIKDSPNPSQSQLRSPCLILDIAESNKSICVRIK